MLNVLCWSVEIVVIVWLGRIIAVVEGEVWIQLNMFKPTLPHPIVVYYY